MKKWQKQVEAILKEYYPDDEEKLEKANKLIRIALDVIPPQGTVGRFIAQVLKVASEEQRPLAATYTAFRLGVAYERHQNELNQV
ncbi:hypothetical protein ES703_00370 [subsurface metagenome]